MSTYQAKEKAVKAQLQSLSIALERFEAHCDTPKALSMLASSDCMRVIGSEENLVDPWGNEIILIVSRNNRDFMSLGSDGLIGTSDDVWGDGRGAYREGSVPNFIELIFFMVFLCLLLLIFQNLKKKNKNERTNERTNDKDRR